MEAPLSDSPPDWAHLPQLAVHLISEKMKSIADYVRLRAVCSPWRSAYLPKPRHHLPWLLMSYWWVEGKKVDEGILFFYDPWESKMHKLQLPETSGMMCCASYRGWLLLVGSSGEVFLLNPLTRARIQLTPFTNGDLIPLMRRMTFSVDPTNQNCLITVFPLTCWLFICCRVGDPCWTMVNTSLSPETFATYKDATYYDGRFYLLYQEAVKIIDSNKPEEGIVHLLEPELAAVNKLLIEGHSGVYVVVPVHEDYIYPVAHDTKDTEKGPKQKIDLYEIQEQPLKLKKVTGASNAIFFCHGNVFDLAVCSDDWGSLDGGSMYMVGKRLYEGGRSGSYYNIYTAKLDDYKLKLVMSEVGKELRSNPYASMWFQPSLF